MAGHTYAADHRVPVRGQRAYVGLGLSPRRLTDPALSTGELPPLDFVVLSHHHGDHFDRIAAHGLDHDLPIITEPHAARNSTVMAHADAEVRVTPLLGYAVSPVMGSLLDFSRGGQRLLRLYITASRPRSAN